MTKKQIIVRGLINAIGVFVYIVLVAWLMNNAEKMFGKMNTVIAAAAFLALFTLSAAVVGGLVIGQPLMLYFDGKKREAINLFCSVVAWIFVITVAVFVYLWLK